MPTATISRRAPSAPEAAAPIERALQRRRHGFGKDSQGKVRGEVVVAHQQGSAVVTGQPTVAATSSPRSGTLAATTALPNTAAGTAAAPLASLALLLCALLLRPVARRRRNRGARTLYSAR